MGGKTKNKPTVSSVTKEKIFANYQRVMKRECKILRGGLWLRQEWSLSKKYLRLNRSQPGKNWGESISGRRNGICEGPKAG